MNTPTAIEQDNARAPYQRHSATSAAAAAAVEPRTGTGRAIILAYMRGRESQGATDEQMQESIPMGANTQRPRRVELVNARLLVDSGTVRSTRTGGPATVWVAAEYAGSF